MVAVEVPKRPWAYCHVSLCLCSASEGGTVVVMNGPPLFVRDARCAVVPLRGAVQRYPFPSLH